MVSIGKKEREGVIQDVASRLKFPWLLVLMILLFVVDLFFPDPIPFIDEVILGLLAVGLGMWREKREAKEPPMKNVTPPRSSTQAQTDR